MDGRRGLSGGAKTLGKRLAVSVQRAMIEPVQKERQEGHDTHRTPSIQKSHSAFSLACFAASYALRIPRTLLRTRSTAPLLHLPTLQPPPSPGPRFCQQRDQERFWPGTRIGSTPRPGPGAQGRAQFALCPSGCPHRAQNKHQGPNHAQRNGVLVDFSGNIARRGRKLCSFSPSLLLWSVFS